MMTTRKSSTPIKVWVTPEEKEVIEEKAAQHGLSRSAYLRNLGLGYTVESILDHKAVLELSKVNADLGRVGGLLKLYLSQDNPSYGPAHVRHILRQIEGLQDEMREKLKSL